MALSFGAEAVWIGTRFVASVEAGAPQYHKDAGTFRTTLVAHWLTVSC